MITPFGTTPSGRAVQAVTLTAGDLAVQILTLGATLRSVRHRAIGHDLTTGSRDLADYEGAMRYHGALVGPVANRFTGGIAPIAGVPHRFERNQNDLHLLHSGSAGTHAKVWQIADHGPDHLTLTLTLPDGEGGFPGTRHVTARYTVAAPAALRLDVTTRTDRPSLVNFTNHSFWCLDGGSDWAGQTLRLAADHYLPTTASFAPTGEIAAVAGTPFDFREPRAMRPGEPDLDNTFCVSPRRVPLRDVMELRARSGTRLTVATTEPGLHLYDQRPGYAALAIEAQSWPDAPNHAGFPGIEITPDAPVTQSTEWRVSV